MSVVDIRILTVVLGTIVIFTVVANVIPQVESEVPEELEVTDDITPEELVDAGRRLYEGAGGCLACHSETPGARGPNILTDYQGEGLIGERCADRIPDTDCKEYLFQALVDPQAHMIGDYPPIMPPADRALDRQQVWAVVAYLQSVGGEVTVTADDVLAEADAPAPEPAEAVVAQEPEAIVAELCLMCHLLEGEGEDIGPPFDGIGERRTAEELRLAILDPPAVVEEGYEDMVGMMPPNFGDQLTASQLEGVVRYLAGLR